MTVEIQLKGGHTTSDPRLDRIPEFDEASRGYQVREFLTGLVAKRRRSHTYRPPLDQGLVPLGSDANESSGCTGFSTVTCLRSSPFLRPLGQDDGFDFYHGARRFDQWSGENYAGSSVLGVMKYARSIGQIREYRWCGAGSGLTL